MLNYPFGGLIYTDEAMAKPDLGEGTTYENRRRVPLRLHQGRRRSGLGEDYGLPLHGLPSGHLLRLPRNVPVPGATFRITGQPATYLKTTAESGNPRLQAFCPRCGSPIYSTSPGEGQQASYMVRVGILRQSRNFIPRRQNWFRSALPWVSSLATLHRNEKQA